jgi:hypothetical protein
MNRLGNQRMAKVYPLLKRHVAHFQPVCTLLEGAIYRPLQTGTRLHINPPKLGSTGSLQEKIEAAVDNDEPAGETAGGEEGRMEVD